MVGLLYGTHSNNNEVTMKRHSRQMWDKLNDLEIKNYINENYKYS